MKALKYIVFLLLIAIIAIAVYIAVQPSSYDISRTRTIKAPTAVIYNNVIDFKNWEAWSSWKEKDPDLIITLPEQTSGVGGSYSWQDKDGKGRMKTLATEVNKSIDQELQFGDYDPSQVFWTFEPQEDGSTQVNWRMKSDKVPFKFKGYAAYKGGFDNILGPDFERSLEKLDSLLVEHIKQYNITVDGVTEYGGGFYLYKTTNATNANISEKMSQQFGNLMSYLQQNNIQPYGMPLTVYQEMNQTDGTVIMSNGIPVKDRIIVNSDSDILCGYIPKMKVLKTTLSGNYTNLGEAWNNAMTHIATNNLVMSDEKPFEIYANDPSKDLNPSTWKTEIYIPLKE